MAQIRIRNSVPQCCSLLFSTGHEPQHLPKEKSAIKAIKFQTALHYFKLSDILELFSLPNWCGQVLVGKTLIQISLDFYLLKLCPLLCVSQRIYKGIKLWLHGWATILIFLTHPWFKSLFCMPWKTSAKRTSMWMDIDLCAQQFILQPFSYLNIFSA